MNEKVLKLDNGSEVLISEKQFRLYHLSDNGDSEPSKFGLLLTDEIKKAVINSCKD